VSDDLHEEQVRYYRERASEYDTTSRPADDPFAAIDAEIAADLRRLGPVELAIELGPGTGNFTAVVADFARRVIAVDSSPEMLAINEEKVRAPNVTRVADDVFAWTPPERASLVVFAFLLSHVPLARFDPFWAAVGDMLAPIGRVFVADEASHVLWDEDAVDGHDDVVYRTLSDGRRFRIVKRRWDPVDLEARLASLGWTARFTRRDPFFWGIVTRR
jgi:SAM-dependent methyltransferase